MKSNRTIPVVQALLAALFFGASAPLSKKLLGETSPVLLAALLYLGSGFSLLCVKLMEKTVQYEQKEARLARSDWPWLFGAILAGGVIAPIMLMISLRHVPAATASLLLNFEGVTTTLIAAIVFKEAIGRRAWWAIGLITLASILLSTDFTNQWGFSLSALGILAACVMWGVDNNLTRNISAKDPLVIVTVKGLGAGLVSLIIAVALGNTFPSPGVTLLALLLGSLSYGLSIFLFVHAMRGLGAGRTSALFGTAPLAGILLSFLIFREIPGIFFFIALLVIASGAYILLIEDHDHVHVHENIVHEHRHTHNDGHHVHEHAVESARQSHSHVHAHDILEHAHDHAPDIHHRHSHATEPS
ncbi:MAG: EamA family transporter [Anaerolineales bacterium]|nr:EamA family transporter [Anaerolineales bacterium]